MTRDEIEIQGDIERAAGLSSPLPCNLDAEAAVLGAVLLGNGSLMPGLIETGLTPEDFYRSSHGLVWQSICDLHRAGRGVDYLVLTEYLRQTGTLDSVGGRATIDLLAGAVPAVGNAREYAAIVRKLAVWRRRLRATYRMQSAAEQLNEEAFVRAWESIAP